MNNEPKPDSSQEGQPLYRAEDDGQSFVGYDLTQPTTVPNSVEAPIPPEMPQSERETPLLDWEASEYVHHTKGPLWYIGFAVLMLALLAVAFFMTQSWTFMALVVVMTIAMGVFAARPPRKLHYVLMPTSVQIENVNYKFSDFRAFGIVHDGKLYSIALIPTKRFMPAVNIYFSESDGEKIVDILGSRLPMQQMQLDVIDRLMRRLRF